MTAANLTNVNLFWADLKGANLQGAVVRHCRMNRASRSSVACLKGTDFSQSNMIEADLRNADLADALFVSTNMNGADLSRCSMSGRRLSPAP